MKLIKCNYCESMLSIREIVFICNCGYCYCKRIANSRVVRVYGPCKVFAVKDESLKLGKGMIWKIREPHPEVDRVTELEKLFSE